MSIQPISESVWDPSFDLRETWLPSTWTVPPLEELPALVAFLVATPEARQGLANTTRTIGLLEQLATKSWIRPRPPSEPMLGDKLDLFVAVNHVLDAIGWRRFGGHPVRGEALPRLEDIAARARLHLINGVSARVDDEVLIQAVEAHLQVGAWPFDVLVDSDR